jgi:hypothetical protein
VKFLGVLYSSEYCTWSKLLLTSLTIIISYLYGGAMPFMSLITKATGFTTDLLAYMGFDKNNPEPVI